MSAYIIGELTVTDPAEFEGYRARVGETLVPYGGRFLVRGGTAVSLEGDWEPLRVVVLEFPNTAQARAWFGSPAYLEILPIRLRAAQAKLILVEGVPAAAEPASVESPEGKFD